MKDIRTPLLILLACLPSFTAFAEQQIGQQLRMSYYRQNTAPQLFFTAEGEPTHGILYDLGHAISGKVTRKLELLPIPRKRLEQALQKNIIDLHCVANPQWFSLPGLRWSSPLYNNPDLLINRLNLKELSDIASLKALKVGTSLGYVYPELAQLITKGSIQPVVSITPEQSYQMYRKGRVSAFVSASIEASVFERRPEDSVIILNKNSIHCVYSPSLSNKLVEQLNQAIIELKAEGKVDDILGKYQYLEHYPNLSSAETIIAKN